MLLDIDLTKNIYFLNIGRYKHDDTFFEWKSDIYHKSPFFDIRMTRNAPLREIFFCINKSDIKMVYYVKKDTVFTIGANPELQSILIETLLEYIITQFYDIYDESLLYACYGETCHIFNGFTSILLDILKNYQNLNLFKISLVNCKACGKTIKIIIKKSLIENHPKPNVPIVYMHGGHALLVYIDKQYKVRGSELVTISL
ncbi:MAG: hypothetical protein ACP6IY_14635 [Promethearchaeia archaeon]